MTTTTMRSLTRQMADNPNTIWTGTFGMQVSMFREIHIHTYIYLHTNYTHTHTRTHNKYIQDKPYVQAYTPSPTVLRFEYVPRLNSIAQKKHTQRGLSIRPCVRLFHTQKYPVYLLHTPWSRVLLEKLTGFQSNKKFPTFHGIRSFINAFISARHLSLSWASSI